MQREAHFGEICVTTRRTLRRQFTVTEHRRYDIYETAAESCKSTNLCFNKGKERRQETLKRLGAGFVCVGSKN